LRRTRPRSAPSRRAAPTSDGLQALTDAGVIAIAEPGGSVRDPEVIEAAQQAGVTLYFTGVRHFWHYSPTSITSHRPGSMINMTRRMNMRIHQESGG
jgi:hypothetical protein